MPGQGALGHPVWQRGATHDLPAKSFGQVEGAQNAGAQASDPSCNAEATGRHREDGVILKRHETTLTFDRRDPTRLGRAATAPGPPPARRFEGDRRVARTPCHLSRRRSRCGGTRARGRPSRLGVLPRPPRQHVRRARALGRRLVRGDAKDESFGHHGTDRAHRPAGPRCIFRQRRLTDVVRNFRALGRPI